MPIATTTMPKVKTDAGVGLSAKEFPSHIKADEPSQTSRALAIGSYFLSGCMAWVSMSASRHKNDKLITS